MSTKKCLEETRTIRVLAEIIVPQPDVEEEMVPECEDSDIEEQTEITDLCHRNQLYLQSVMQSARWEVQYHPLENGEQVQVITSPTTSHMNYKLLHPSFYCDLENLGDLNDLAMLVNAPDDWEELLEPVEMDICIRRNFHLLRDLPESASEADVSGQFAALVSSIAQALQVSLASRSQTPITVGGILVDKNLFLRSNTDVHFSKNGLNVIATELKAANALPAVWYRGSCGIQAISAMYAHRCPTFVASQKQWKLIVQNRNRDGILTYPFEPAAETRAGSILLKPLGSTFFKAIAICILSAPDGAAVGSGASVSEAELIPAAPATPEVMNPRRAHSSLEKPSKKARSGNAGGTEPHGGDGASKQMLCPSSGGLANQGVRVLDDGDVRAIEARIAAAERARASARHVADAGTADVAAA